MDRDSDIIPLNIDVSCDLPVCELENIGQYQWAWEDLNFRPHAYQALEFRPKSRHFAVISTMDPVICRYSGPIMPYFAVIYRHHADILPDLSVTRTARMIWTHASGRRALRCEEPGRPQRRDSFCDIGTKLTTRQEACISQKQLRTSGHPSREDHDHGQERQTAEG